MSWFSGLRARCGVTGCTAFEFSHGRSGWNWDAAAVMARSALQAALRDRGAEGNSLKKEIDDLAARGVLPPHMKEWAHELRALGNESAHPESILTKSSANDVRDIIEFLDFLLKHLYNLPHEIQEYRQRRAGKSNNA